MIDLHIAVTEIDSDSMTRLTGVGFQARKVLRGLPRAPMTYLLTAKAPTLEAGDQLFVKTTQMLDSVRGFVGFVEEETLERLDAVRCATRSSAPANYGKALEVSACPPGRFKGADVHASATYVSADIEQALVSAGFYTVVWEKAGVGEVTVFTAQTENVDRGRQVFDELKSFLSTAGGFEGLLRFELTRAIQNFKAVLPSLILNV